MLSCLSGGEEEGSMGRYIFLSRSPPFFRPAPLPLPRGGCAVLSPGSVPESRDANDKPGVHA